MLERQHVDGVRGPPSVGAAFKNGERGLPVGRRRPTAALDGRSSMRRSGEVPSGSWWQTELRHGGADTQNAREVTRQTQIPHDPLPA
jgi:hypothetical protein